MFQSQEDIKVDKETSWRVCTGGYNKLWPRQRITPLSE